LRDGLWQGSGYSQNIKLINVPVLKHHDTGGSEITGSLKHFYGIVSMSDGQSGFRHYQGLGETCGKMVVSVRTPVLNIIDAIWVSYSSLTGYPQSTTFKANQILASQDPVALDYWAAKHILYPVDNNPRHRPDFPGINQWLTDACNMINDRGGLYNVDNGILVNRVTKRENEMLVFVRSTTVDLLEPIGGDVIPSGSTYTIRWEGSSPAVKFGLLYSMDNGLTWRWITDGFVTDSSYDWRVPTPRSNKKLCFVKVIGYNASSVKVGADKSEAPFTIEVVRLTAPSDPGISLNYGEIYNITWTTHATKTLVETVELYYTKNAATTPVTWIPIGTFKIGDYPDMYPWQVPRPAKTKTKCRVKVVLKDAHGQKVGVDVSDNNFAIPLSP